MANETVPPWMLSVAVGLILTKSLAAPRWSDIVGAYPGKISCCAPMPGIDGAYYGKIHICAPISVSTGLITAKSLSVPRYPAIDGAYYGKIQSSPNLCVHSSSSYVSPSMLPLSSGDLIEWSLVCHSTLSYQKFCDRHSNHYDHPEELHQSVE